jgi:hypothetical protein
MSVLHNVVRGAQDGTHVPLKVTSRWQSILPREIAKTTRKYHNRLLMGLA